MSTNAAFKITDIKLHVPAATLLIEDGKRLLLSYHLKMNKIELFSKNIRHQNLKWPEVVKTSVY